MRNVKSATIKFTGRSAEELIDLRGGEALGCLHSLDDPKGCGFGPYCEKCSVRQTVLDTFETDDSHYQVEANLPLVRGEKQEELNVLVSTTPVSVSGNKNVLVCLENITDRKQAEEVYKPNTA